jgi:hypothetical protein
VTIPYLGIAETKKIHENMPILRRSSVGASCNGLHSDGARRELDRTAQRPLRRQLDIAPVSCESAETVKFICHSALAATDTVPPLPARAAADVPVGFGRRKILSLRMVGKRAVADSPPTGTNAG